MADGREKGEALYGERIGSNFETFFPDCCSKVRPRSFITMFWDVIYFAKEIFWQRAVRTRSIRGDSPRSTSSHVSPSKDKLDTLS